MEEYRSRSTPYSVIPNQFNLVIPYDPDLTGPWTLTFTNDATTAPHNHRHDATRLEGVAPAPMPTNVMESGSGLNPTFTWSYPPSVNGVTVEIYEKGIHIDP